MKKIVILIFLLFLLTPSFAAKHNSSAARLKHSEQLLVVTTPSWDSISGQLQRYERNDRKDHWQPVGTPIPVVVGKHGMAWGMSSVQQISTQAPTKKEGDLRTPAGIFSVGSAFGFAPGYIKNIKLPYIQLAQSSVCVDDVKSKFYNQIIDSSKIKKPDWNSGEQMRQIPQYMWGMIVDYNSVRPIAGSGSCTFIHIWKNSTQATAGCVAMAEPSVELLITWITPAKNPLVVILPKDEYQSLEKVWGLPTIKYGPTA